MSTRRSGCAIYLPPILFIILVASIVAAGIFVGIPYIWGQPEYPRGTYIVQVQGEQVKVVSDPNQEVMFYQEVGTGGQTVGALATATPVILPSPGPSPTAQILPTAAPTAVPARDCITFIDYPVQPGDTLFSISRRYVTSIPLMARFGISSVSLIPGMSIRLPVGDATCCTGGWQPYAVHEGDTWFGIAQKCGVTVDTLLAGNGLGAGAPLYLATIICIP